MCAVPVLYVHQPEMTVEPPASGYKTWQCLLCAFVYDEALGMPDEGIAPGTRWEDVPDDWTLSLIHI